MKKRFYLYLIFALIFSITLVSGSSFTSQQYNAWIYSILSVTLVSLISLIGVVTLSIKTTNLKKIVIYLVSFAAGALLGDAFIHLLPEIVEEFGFTIKISLFVLLGILISFFLEKIIHWTHCHHTNSKNHKHPFAYLNLIGDAVHNLLDGIIIGASYLVNMQVGIATTIAVIFHEIPQEIGDFGVLIHGGFTKSKALLLNFATALTSIAGAVIALVVGTKIENFTLFLIPIAAGNFIYIASADLIPELHKETIIKKSILQILMFILGIITMLILLLLK